MCPETPSSAVPRSTSTPFDQLLFPPVDNPHPTVLLALASVAVSLGSVPLYWVGDFQLGSVHHCLLIVLTVMAMLLAALGARTMFLVRWQDTTHPSVLMGTSAIAIGMTAVPLRCTGAQELGSLHQGLFITITLVSMLFASSCVATALGRMTPAGIGGWPPPADPRLPETGLQTFPRTLDPAVLDDIADTYEGVWLAIEAAHDAGVCSRKFVRSQVDRLRGLAARVGIAPTDVAIRAEADVFDHKARRAARSLNSEAALYIREQCYRRFAAAVTAANHRREPRP